MRERTLIYYALVIIGIIPLIGLFFQQLMPWNWVIAIVIEIFFLVYLAKKHKFI